MRKFFLMILAWTSVGLCFAGDAVIDKLNCTITKDGKTFPLYGKVQIVNSFPDIKVQIVKNFSDVQVQIVNSFPTDCGKVQIVNSFPDVKVQIVNSFPDVKIEVVNSFPGIK